MRELLSWFDASGRGRHVISLIRASLDRVGVETVPDFENTWIDNRVGFVVAGSDDSTAKHSASTRIDALDSANRSPLTVKPDTTLSECVTIMLSNEYSQLPVMTTTREVKGAVSWRSVGSRLALCRSCSVARECLDPAEVVPGNMSLFDAISIVAKHDFVLVRGTDQTISGIVTVSDLSDQFRDLAEPFVLIGEIETLLRRMIHGKFSTDELAQIRHPQDADRHIEGVSDLTLGEYIRLLENETNWQRVGLSVDRARLVNLCNRVREIRNDVMHFDPQGPGPDAMEVLREAAGFLRELMRIGVI